MVGVPEGLTGTVPSLPAPAPAAPPSPSAAAAGVPSLSGSGLLTLPDTSTLAPGRFTVGLGLDNRDRDPLGLDLFDYSLAWTAGVAPRLETYGRWVLSRVVSMPEPPALPPPHLDIVAASGPAPPRPHYAIQPAVPYVNRRGTARFGAFVPGDAVVGLKLRLAEAEGVRPSVAVSGEVKAPLSRKVADLQSGSGTGAVDGTARVTAQWQPGACDVLAAASYTWTGRPPLGDRAIVIGADGNAAVTDLPLVLPDRVELGVGARRGVSRRLAAVLEVTTALDVGASTATVDAATPVDVVAGLQARFGGARLGLGLRYHGHALPSGQRRPSPVAGFIDMTGVDDEALADWLAAVGAAPAAPHLRAGSQRLVAGVRPDVALPDGARVLPEEYVVRSEHQLGFVVVWAWAF